MIPGMARPPLENPRRINRGMRLAPDEDALLHAAATAAGAKSQADWMRDELLKRARKVVKSSVAAEVART